ncbi:hypothetical protein C1646_772510 [Rhizophagus diaphanus]|nr:hypothetical protein C1646_772510 [Rhizophagus diaphanus] [Rhizophagus sp. MUCL 43196]
MRILPSIINLPSPSNEEQNDDNDNLNKIEEFILIDDNNNYRKEEITDEEIVNMIKSNEINLAEEEIVLQPKISASEVLTSLDKVLSFFDNPPDNFMIELNNRNLLKS